MPKIALVDLDGVLNTYSGSFNESFIDPPRSGVREFLENLSQNYIVKIFTVRNKKSVFKWLQNHKLLDYIEDITDIKHPNVSLIIDDRAIGFDGNFEKTLSLANNFKPHWKK